MTDNRSSIKQLLEGFDRLVEADNKSNLMQVNYKFPFRKKPMIGQGFEGTLQEAIDRKIVSEKTQRNLKEVKRLAKLSGSDLTWTHFCGILVIQPKTFSWHGSKVVDHTADHRQAWTYVVFGKDQKGNLFGFDRRETAHPGAGQTWVSINNNTDRIGHSLTLQFFVDSLGGKKLEKKDITAAKTGIWDTRNKDHKEVKPKTKKSEPKKAPETKKEPAAKKPDTSASIYEKYNPKG